MANDPSAEKLAYAKALYAEGTSAPAKIQQAVKKKFGSGMNFRDLAKVFPRKPGAKRKKAAGKRKAPYRKQRGQARGKSDMKWLLLVGGEYEAIGGRQALEVRIAELVAQGHSAKDIKVYERTPLKMTLRTSITL